MYKVSDTANRLIALIGNAKQLAIFHQQRSSSIGVIKACRVLAEQKKFNIDPFFFDVIVDGIMGKTPAALKEAFESLENRIVAIDMEDYDSKHPSETIDFDKTQNNDFMYIG